VALEAARQRFAEKWGKTSSASINVLASDSKNIAGLQAADYFLWSLQRFYERGESRYLDFLWPAFRLIRDVDDTRKTSMGVLHTTKAAHNSG